MYARITRVEGSPDQMEIGVRNFEEQTLPAAKKMDGFCGAVLVGDRDTGQAMAITLWASEAHLKKSEEAASQLRREAAERLGARRSPTVERFEVLSYAVEAEPEAQGPPPAEPPRVSP